FFFFFSFLLLLSFLPDVPSLFSSSTHAEPQPPLIASTPTLSGDVQPAPVSSLLPRPVSFRHFVFFFSFSFFIFLWDVGSAGKEGTEIGFVLVEWNVGNVLGEVKLHDLGGGHFLLNGLVLG